MINNDTHSMMVLQSMYMLMFERFKNVDTQVYGTHTVPPAAKNDSVRLI